MMDCSVICRTVGAAELIEDMCFSCRPQLCPQLFELPVSPLNPISRTSSEKLIRARVGLGIAVTGAVWNNCVYVIV